MALKSLKKAENEDWDWDWDWGGGSEVGLLLESGVEEDDEEEEKKWTEAGVGV